MDSLRIKKIDLSDVGPFKKLHINFKNESGLNIICGSNGIGKSTILEAIASAFTVGNSHRLKRRVDADFGAVNVDMTINGISSPVTLPVSKFNPSEGDFLNNRLAISSALINIRASRDFSYQPQTSIERDPEFKITSHTQSITNGVNPANIKKWFTNRYLLKPHADKDSWTDEMKENLDLAISCFSILDNSVQLDEVNIKTFDIIASTPSGKVPFELLSSGFRSAYTLLLGIIREIETRDLNVSAKEFSGVVLVDEIDLHLHPTWQKEIGSALKKSFPMAQIIATTHSPHVIQAAEADEVIALVREESGNVFVRSLPTTKFGYAGWTVEEILEEIMGLEDTKTSVFRRAVKNFDDAIDAEDAPAISKAVDELQEMLHPNNSLRKLIKIQAAPFIDNHLEGEDRT